MEISLKLPVTYSLVSPLAIGEKLILLYKLPRPSTVIFVHQGINDTYLITTPQEKFILRIYRANWKTIDDVRAELDLLLRLSDHGLSVSYPLADKSGDFIQMIDCPEGIRFAVLFSHASGEGLTSLNSQTANLFGQYVGRLHNISESLELHGNSREYTRVAILDNTRRVLQKLLPTSGEVYERAENIFSQLGEKLIDQLLRDVRSGICHGDLHHENIFMEPSSGKITLFDFDFCCRNQAI
jgi:Ser/Thr protein kinase RdoA (MazF antagonist)